MCFSKICCGMLTIYVFYKKFFIMIIRMMRNAYILSNASFLTKIWQSINVILILNQIRANLWNEYIVDNEWHIWVALKSLFKWLFILFESIHQNLNFLFIWFTKCFDLEETQIKWVFIPKCLYTFKQTSNKSFGRYLLKYLLHLFKSIL